ncbi:lipid kinase [Planosporangium flavigriseum]|uniref:Diacylglycerol kinase n=1 Tax=Planosporangium flavigriseum TaxID=373681 RepID=A0A8J3LY56_9ACTN|nr:diacylglycerol kinase family protein [Planosporangium flavigriseum]NJC63837.1 lipid kinase [Planosporangium flavigriseum]GIG75939.1 diacylglycerol kinase [Planosporangium flavigriseum]
MLVVTNELAGRTEAEAVNEVTAELGGESAVEVITCRQDSDLESLLDRRAGRTVVVVGGDGSLHTLLRHLWRRGEAADCTVGLVPLGTGNDFARGVGIPLDHREAARLVRTGQPRPVDLIVDDTDGVTVNAVHVGAGAEAAMLARPWKRRLRTAAFPLGAIAAGFSVDGWRLRIEVDGKLVTSGKRKVLMAGLSNAPSIAGGSAQLGPGADPTDGQIEITVSLATGRLARLGYSLALLRGRHPERSDVINLSGTTATISGSPFHVNADGELNGPVRRREWRVVPGAWRCVLPDVAG